MCLLYCVVRLVVCAICLLFCASQQRRLLCAVDGVSIRPQAVCGAAGRIDVRIVSELPPPGSIAVIVSDPSKVRSLLKVACVAVQV